MVSRVASCWSSAWESNQPRPSLKIRQGVQAEAVGVGEFLGPRFVAVDPILWGGIQLGWSFDERGDAVRNVIELSRW